MKVLACLILLILIDIALLGLAAILSRVNDRRAMDRPLKEDSHVS